MLDIINGNGGMEWQHTAYLNFVDKFCNTKLKASPFPLSYWMLIIVLGMLLFLAGRLSKNLLLRKQIYLLDVCMILGGFAYAGAMMLTYIYAFKEYEGIRTVCYTRYMGTYTFAFFALIIMIFVSRWWAKNCERISLIKLAVTVILIWLALLPTQNIKYLVPILKDNSVAAGLKPDAEIIKNNTEEDAKIYLISQWNNGEDKFRLSYLTLPRTYNSKGYSLGEKYYDEDAWTQNLDPEIWQESLRA